MANEKEVPFIVLGEKVALGERKTIDFSIAKLYTSTKIDIPIIIDRAKKPSNYCEHQ